MEMVENAQPKQGGRFRKGQSGNPAGKPKGARHRVTLAAEALLDGEAEGLSRKAVELALQGDTVALRLCLERILPPRKDRPIPFSLPALKTAADAAQATAAIVRAVATGELTPTEATELSRLVETFARTLEVSEFEARLAALEQRMEPRR
jgi:hypothetical protein